MFPMGIGSATKSQRYEDAMGMLFDCLPPTPRAWSLLEACMENASWMVQPIKREHLIEDFLTPIYNKKKEYEDPDTHIKTEISPHKVAVLFLVFAIGANVDLTLPPGNDEAEKYHHYARAALTLRSVFDSPMMETIQALLLLSHHCSTAGERHSRDSAWSLIGLGCKLALSVSFRAFSNFMILNTSSSSLECVSALTISPTQPSELLQIATQQGGTWMKKLRINGGGSFGNYTRLICSS